MNEQKASKSPVVTQESSNPGKNSLENLLRQPFLMEVRHEAIVASSEEHDDQRITIDLLIKMCQALVNSNREIWDRCKPFYCHHVKSDDNSKEKCTFFRVRGFVEAWTRRANYYYSSPYHNELILETGPYVTKLAFEIPIRLPPRLEHLVVNPSPVEDDIMPDFGLFLRRSMLLIDDVLPLFLRDFKVFLESQQVAMGKVDAWLFHDRYEQLLTLLDQHGVDAHWDRGGLFEIDPSHVVHIRNNTFYNCVRCEEAYKNHGEDAETGWVQCITDTKNHGQGCFPVSDESKKRLLSCPFFCTIKFKVSTETPEERLWLIKCLEFVGHDTTKLAQGETFNSLG